MLTRREPLKRKESSEFCYSPEHNPPMFMVYEPGEYEWVCETCGTVQWFTIPRISCTKEVPYKEIHRLAELHTFRGRCSDDCREAWATVCRLARDAAHQPYHP